MDQNLSSLDLKLLTDSADTTLSGKLFHIGTVLCVKNNFSVIHVYIYTSVKLSTL